MMRMKQLALVLAFALLACCLCSPPLFAEAPAALSDEEFLKLARNGTPEDVMRAVKNGANVNAVNDVGETALLYSASHNDDPAMLNALLQSGADALAKDKWGFDALWRILRGGGPRNPPKTTAEYCAAERSLLLALAPAIQDDGLGQNAVTPHDAGHLIVGVGGEVHGVAFIS